MCGWLLLSCFPLLDSRSGSWRGFLSARRVMFLRTLALTTNILLSSCSLHIVSHYHSHTESPQMDVCIVQSQFEISVLPIPFLCNHHILTYNWIVSTLQRNWMWQSLFIIAVVVRWCIVYYIYLNLQSIAWAWAAATLMFAFLVVVLQLKCHWPTW